MTEFTMDRLRENLESLKMKNPLEILDNYLERAYEKQIQMSGFPIKKTLDDFDFSFQPSIDKRQIDELATMRFLENGENVVFLGPPGVGKTHLASALGLVAKGMGLKDYKNRDWVEVSARMAVENHDAYQGKGPVMHVMTIAPCPKPAQDVVTF